MKLKIVNRETIAFDLQLVTAKAEGITAVIHLTDEKQMQEFANADEVEINFTSSTAVVEAAPAAPVVSEPVVTESTEPVAPVVSEPVVTESTEPVAPVVSEPVVTESTEPVAPVTE